jgi:formamidopyrimidine-DNA glycosylase
MPELPEVETLVRGLRGRLTRLRFSKIEVNLKKCVQESPRSFAHSLEGRRILFVERRGKNIIIRLNGGISLLIHLRMTGGLRMVPGDAPLEKHTHVVFSFQGRPWQLRFLDPRQFGRLAVEESRAGGELASLTDLGPDPLEISDEKFVSLVRSKRRSLKPLLLDQHFLAGVGNIYADEALHRARIHPRQRTEELEEKFIIRLSRALRQILREAIRAGGTSVRTFADARGSAGRFQKFLQVYGREGEACETCGAGIVREKVGGRSSYYCPCCQSLRPGTPQRSKARKRAMDPGN